MTIILDGNGVSELEFHGYAPSDRLITLSYTPLVEVTGGTGDPVVIGDATWHEHADADVLTTAVVSSDWIGTKFQSLDPDIATVDEDTGVVTRVANGTARIVGMYPRGFAGRVDVPVSLATGQSTTHFHGYNAGTFAKAVADLVAASIAGTVIGSTPYPERMFPPNVSNWNQSNWAIAAGVNIYCLSYYTSVLGARGGLAPLTNRLCLIAKHYDQLATTGYTATWRTPDNVDITREVTAYQPVTGDIGLVLLGSALPTEIGFVRVLPSNWRDYLATITDDVLDLANRDIGIPSLQRDQNNRTMLHEWYGDYPNGTPPVYGSNCFSDPSPTDATLASYFRAPQGGDSSNSNHLIHPDDLYLIAEDAGNGNGGTSIVSNRTALENKMDEMLAGSTCTEASLTGYEL